MFRISCAAYSFREALTRREMSLIDLIRHCADWGLDGVELTGYYFPDTARATLNALKRECFRYGLAVAGTATRNHFTHPDADFRKAEVERVKQWIDIAVALGAPMLRIFADQGIPPGYPERQVYDWSRECIEQSLAYAESQGVVLALETHWGLTADAERTLRFVRDLNSPYFGILLDGANTRENHYEMIEKLAPYAVSVHAKTHSRNLKDKFFELDYERIFRILKAAGYRGYVAIEYEYTEPPMQAVPRFAKKLLALRERMKKS
ncbi:MAG: sugar phosphate isomerase/epimerase [Fimbriimonadales bacterium]|nr:sugar phosphate isomerase/epimerase [Fimbriimonadales bacterium]